MDKTGPDQTRPDQTRLEHTISDQTRPEWTEQNWTGLDWTRPDRTRADQNGSYQSRPDRIRPVFSQKKGLFGQLVPENGLPSGQMGTYLKTEGNQSYLGIWGRYDPIEPGLSEAKKVGYMGVA